MKYIKIAAVLVLVAYAILFSGTNSGREQCTSAVISNLATTEGVPLLWKNRDTGVLSNKVVYVKEEPYCYLALVNADAPSGRPCYAGLNSVGFGIMNTVAYNLPKKSGETEDLEGIIMADALRSCQSIEDFENYINANIGPDLGSRANFGVIDSSGKAYLFEIHNHGYEKIDAALSDEKYLVVTNYARSGKPARGAGYLRFERASDLFQELPKNRIHFRDILIRFTRDLGHVLIKNPSFTDLKNLPAEKDFWINSRDCINRPITSAAVVICGKNPSAQNSLATMWVIPGEPLCAIALPLWVKAGSTPEVLWKGEEAPMWKESLRIKDIIRPYKEGNKEDYLNLTRLDNADGTGFLPEILKTEEEIIKMTSAFLKKAHSPEELAAFQAKMSQKALATLRSIH
jgi:hypothetical protein